MGGGIDVYSLDWKKHFFSCHPLEWCVKSKNYQQIDIAIFGDSHARQIFPGLSAIFSNLNIAYYESNGLPILDSMQNEEIVKLITENSNIKTVILTSWWFGRLNPELNRPQIPLNSSLDKELNVVIDVLIKGGKKVLLLGDTPFFPFRPAQCIGKRWFGDGERLCEIDRGYFEIQKQLTSPSFHKLVNNHPGVILIPIGDYFCNLNVCSMSDGENIFYRDDNHLNYNGSLLIGKKLANNFFQSF